MSDEDRARAHVTRIGSNLKGGVEADLGPLTLVVGRNAGGKTSVVTALELALTGRAAEVGAAPAALMELAPEGAGRLEVCAALSDGRTIGFDVYGSTAKAHAPVWSVGGAPSGSAPVGALLATESADLLRRDAKRQREAFLSICCGEVSAEAIGARVPEAFRAEWDRAWAQEARDAEGGGAAADVLVGVAALLRSELRAARAAVKGGAAGERPEAPAAEEVEALRREVGEARAGAAAARQAAYDARLRAEARAEAARDLPRLYAQLAALRADAEASAGGGADSEALRTAHACLGNAADLTQRLAGMAAKRCAACGGAAPAAGWQARRDAIFAHADRIKAELDAALRVPGAAEIERVAAQVMEAEAILGAAPGAVLEAVVGSGGADLDALEAQLREADAALARRSAWERARNDAVRAEARADVLKALVAAADRIVADALEGSIEAFAARAAAVLAPNGPGVGALAVELFDGARRICRVGLRGADGSVRAWRVLSGAERARLLAALACAWGAGRKEAVRMVIVDEVSLGPEALGALCAGLSDAVRAGAVTQAVVCVVDAHAGVLDWGAGALAGWTVVQVGAARRDGETARAAAAVPGSASDDVQL